MTAPTLRLLSLGAGVQSSALSLMAADGALPGLDGAIFADTGWEPRRVYEVVDALEAVLTGAGIPLYRVSAGNLRNDLIYPGRRYASIPYFVLNHEVRQVPIKSSGVECPGCAGTGWGGGGLHNGLRAGEWLDLQDDPQNLPEDRPPFCLTCTVPGGTPGVVYGAWYPVRERVEGMGRRQCTSEYKLAPIGRKVRELLGAEAPLYRRVPRGRTAEQWIGFSTDEMHRVNPAGDAEATDANATGRNRRRRGVSYLTSRYPLIELGMSRTDCEEYLAGRGWGHVAKSACIGCPFHGNRQWRDLRDNSPDEWADAVAFDNAIRKGGARGLPLNGEAFLHASRVPLDQAPIDYETVKERRTRQVDLLDVLENGDPDGCSPYGCRSGSRV